MTPRSIIIDTDPGQDDAVAILLALAARDRLRVEADLSRPLPWELGSDRELDFRREFRRPYYDHAVAHVVNEVEWNKLRLKGRILSAAAFKRKARSLAGRAGMWWWSRTGHNA